MPITDYLLTLLQHICAECADQRFRSIYHHRNRVWCHRNTVVLNWSRRRRGRLGEKFHVLLCSETEFYRRVWNDTYSFFLFKNPSLFSGISLMLFIGSGLSVFLRKIFDISDIRDFSWAYFYLYRFLLMYSTRITWVNCINAVYRTCNSTRYFND